MRIGGPELINGILPLGILIGVLGLALWGVRVLLDRGRRGMDGARTHQATSTVSYHFIRDGERFGPYPAELVYAYLADGRITPDDHVWTEGMTEWLPATEVFAPPAGMGHATPPEIEWPILVLLSVVTVGVFYMIWWVRLSAWSGRVRPASKATVFVIFGLSIAGLMTVVLLANTHPYMRRSDIEFLQTVWMLGNMIVAGLVAGAAFEVRRTILERFRPAHLNLELSGVMTFFFGQLYLQYHLNRLMASGGRHK